MYIFSSLECCLSTLTDDDPYGTFPPRPLPFSPVFGAQMLLLLHGQSGTGEDLQCGWGPPVWVRTSSVLCCTTERPWPPAALICLVLVLQLACVSMPFGCERNKYSSDCKSLIWHWLEIDFFQWLLSSGKGPKKCFWGYFLIPSLFWYFLRLISGMENIS